MELLLLLVLGVSLGNWVVLLSRVLLRRVFLVLIIEGRVVGMTLADAVFVACANQLDESFL